MEPSLHKKVLLDIKKETKTAKPIVLILYNQNFVCNTFLLSCLIFGSLQIKLKFVMFCLELSRKRVIFAIE